MRWAPFLKWAGGKRWLALHAKHLVPHSYRRYFEPFLGGGAMFFAVQPQSAILSDKNEELINCYQQIQKNWSNVWQGVRNYAAEHSDEFYYRIRATRPAEASERAIRFLYLNRSCFNGLYRVNTFGEFNVPKGTKNPDIVRL